MSQKDNQKPGGEDQPTVTSKSSGLQYISASQEPAQEARVEKREPSNKNQK